MAVLKFKSCRYDLENTLKDMTPEQHNGNIAIPEMSDRTKFWITYIHDFDNVSKSHFILKVRANGKIIPFSKYGKKKYKNVQSILDFIESNFDELKVDYDKFNQSETKKSFNSEKSNVNDFAKELKELMTKYNVTLGVDIEGDTQGISTDFIITNETNNKDYVVCAGQSYLDIHDLKGFKA